MVVSAHGGGLVVKEFLCPGIVVHRHRLGRSGTQHRSEHHRLTLLDSGRCAVFYCPDIFIVLVLLIRDDGAGGFQGAAAADKICPAGQVGEPQRELLVVRLPNVVVSDGHRHCEAGGAAGEGQRAGSARIVHACRGWAVSGGRAIQGLIVNGD